MNYLLLTEYFPESEKAEFTGGVESRCFHLVKELSKKHSVTVFCSHQPGQKRESTVFGAKVIRCGPSLPYSNKGNIFRRFLFSYSLFSTGKKIGKNSPDKINLVEGASFIAYPPAYFLGKQLQAKKNATWHETWTGEWIKNKGWATGLFGELWERLSLRLKWDKIISVSDFTKRRLVERKVPEPKIKVVHNGIDLEKIKAVTAEKEKHPTLCYFGRLNWQKNLDLLIKAVAELKKELPKIRCKIIGCGVALGALKQLVKDLSLETNIRFYTEVREHQALLKEAKSCHLYIHPSTLEGFGITLLEAMALDLPYVISDIPPFIEITNNGQGGEIFHQNNLKDLIEKIKCLLSDRKRYEQKIKEEKELIKKYDWKSLAQGYLETEQPS